MGDGAWQEVTYKKRRSVFDRLGNTTNVSKEDEIQKISTFVFITNFPNQFTAKDLWNTCKQYGQIVDAYIPNRRSKAGKRFGFLRFIKVLDVSRLINNLYTVWVGRFKIHANIPRFHREPLNKNSNQHNDTGVERGNPGVEPIINGVKGVHNSYAHIVKENQSMKVNEESKPVLVLDDSCLNQKDYSLCVLSKVKDFASLANLKVVLGNEGFSNIKIRYMGGYWVMIMFQSEESLKSFWDNVGVSTWFSQMQQVSYDFSIDGRVTWVEIEGITLKLWSENTFKRVALKWGVLLDMDDKEDECFHSKRICINTNISTNILESFKIIYRGKVVWVRAKEVPGWVPNFVEDDEEENELDEEFEDVDTNAVELKNIIELEGDSDEDAVPETKFDEPVDGKHDEEDSIGQNKSQSEDPFIIYELLKKKKNVDHKEANSEESFKFPPGFTPQENKDDKGEPSDGSNGNIKESIAQENVRLGEKKANTQKNSTKDDEESICSGHFKKSEIPRSGGSILLIIDELVKVGQTMRYNMEGDC
ncbi:nucleotide-binding alpha-beta plait domain-containing protein [Tanacetum coccineum]